jgi:hypothetical protein
MINLKNIATNGRSVAALAVTLLCGCQTVSAANQESPPIVVSRAVVSEKCLFADNTAYTKQDSFIGGLAVAVGTALIPKAIDVGVGAFAAAVRKAGEESEAEVLNATAGTHAYAVEDAGTVKVSSGGQCLVIARGPVNAKKRLREREPWKSSDKISDKLSELTGINGDPEIFYEALITPSGDQNAIRLDTSRFEYHRDVSGFGSSRDIVLSVQLNKPGGDDGVTPVGIALITFDEIKTGTVLDQKQLKGHTSQWIPLPEIGKDITDYAQTVKASKAALTRKQAELDELEALTEPRFDERQKQSKRKSEIDVILAVEAGESGKRLRALEDKKDRDADALERAMTLYSLDLESAKLDLDLTKPAPIGYEDSKKKLEDQKTKLDDAHKTLVSANRRGAMTFVASIKEVKEANEFLLAIAEVLEESKGAVVTALKDQLDPATRAANKETQNSDAYTLRSAAIKTDQKVQLLTLELERLDQANDPVNYLKKWHELQNAKLAANEARRKAGQAQVYTIE